MDLDPLILSRIQFAFTISFHILFPSFTVGLACWIVVLEARWLMTGRAVMRSLSEFWTKIFAISFGMGVVSGIVMSFQFGTNWSRLSERAGAVLGPLLSYEVLTAFFLEAGFLGVMLFGANKVRPLVHFFCTCMVAVGTLISTFWIIAAISWMHTPQGHEIIDGVVVPVDGPLPEGVLGEVRIHQRIYARRPDVGGICRTQSPQVMALSTLRRTPRPRHGFGAYFAPEVPLWDDPQLIRSAERAEGVAATLGDARAVVMRGNGPVITGRDLIQAVVLSWYLEDAARVELEVLKTGLDGAVLSTGEAAERATEAGRIYERMWEHLAAGDPEAG